MEIIFQSIKDKYVIPDQLFVKTLTGKHITLAIDPERKWKLY